MLSKRLYGMALIGAVSVMAFTQGCSSDNPLCCTADDFQVGGTVKASIGGSAQSQVAVQAVADIAGIAEASLTDLTTACRGIAQDLNADAAAQADAESQTDSGTKMNKWCELAINSITSFKAKASITIAIDVKPPVCEASVSASVDCQAKCSVDAKCDVKLHPPTCEGGKLELSCSGSCKAQANASIACTGKCDLPGRCSGKCSATATAPSIDCQGKCSGTCSVATDSDGNCMGKCSGTCEVKGGADVTCEGSCDGGCTGSCSAEGSAKVTCSGECTGEAEPIRCQGGTLKGGCDVDAKCKGSCDASVSAKAKCTPPQVGIKISAEVDGGANLKATLEANLPIIYGIAAKLEATGKLTGTLTSNVSVSTLGDIKAACIPAVVTAVGSAADKITTAGSVSVKVIGSVG